LTWAAIETDDLDGDEAKEQRRGASKAEVDRSDLSVADLTQPVAEDRLAETWQIALGQRDTGVAGLAYLDFVEDVLIFSHFGVLL
jgi:hypothetical protein